MRDRGWAGTVTRMQRDDAPAYIQAWQCIGCGRIEAPQTCIGVCRDKKVFFVGKDSHEHALMEIAHLRRLLASARSQLLRFAHCTPNEKQFETAFVGLQKQVRELVEQLPVD
jgi:hypothetical protein